MIPIMSDSRCNHSNKHPELAGVQWLEACTANAKVVHMQSVDGGWGIDRQAKTQRDDSEFALSFYCIPCFFRVVLLAIHRGFCEPHLLFARSEADKLWTRDQNVI
jgi:hypothetical protein